MAYLVDSFVFLDRCLKALPETTHIDIDGHILDKWDGIEEVKEEVSYEPSSESGISRSQYSSRNSSRAHLSSEQEHSEREVLLHHA